MSGGRRRLRHPGIEQFLELRARDVHARVADTITAFAGSMTFVYVHVVAFAVWMLVAERSPWPTLTLVVSLEAIFLSTFVLIGQNRQTAMTQAKADHDFVAQELELQDNTALTRQLLRLLEQMSEAGTKVPAGPGLSTLPVGGTTEQAQPQEEMTYE